MNADTGTAERGRALDRSTLGGRDEYHAGAPRVDAVLLEHLLHALHAAALAEGVRAAGAEDRAALLRDALDLVAGEGHRVVVDEAAPAVLEADEVEAVDLGAFADRAADDGVEAGGVAASGQDADAPDPRTVL